MNQSLYKVILIGTISGLYSLLINLCNENSNHDDYSSVFNNLDSVVSELKEDTLILLVLFVINLILLYMSKITVKYHILSNSKFSYLVPYLSKQILISSTSIFLIFLGILIIYDIVSSIFTIHEAYLFATRKKMQNNSEVKSQDE